MWTNSTQVQRIYNLPKKLFTCLVKQTQQLWTIKAAPGPRNLVLHLFLSTLPQISKISINDHEQTHSHLNRAIPFSWEFAKRKWVKPRCKSPCSAQKRRAEISASEVSRQLLFTFIAPHKALISSKASVLITQWALSFHFIAGINSQFEAQKAIKMCD